MRRLFALLLCAALAVQLAGCADTGAARKDTPTLEEGSHGADETPFIRTDSYFSETQEREMAESQNAREQYIVNELSEAARRAVDSLPEPDGEIFRRHYFLYQKTEAIAADMGINAATVRTKLARGRKRLKAYLTERGYSVESIYN